MNLPEGSFIIFPNIFGNQYVKPAEGSDDRDREERVVEVGEHEVGVVEVDVRAAAPRKMPVTPPIRNSAMKASAQSIGVVSVIEPP